MLGFLLLLLVTLWFYELSGVVPAGARALAWELDEVTLEEILRAPLSPKADTLGNGSMPVFFCEGHSLPGVTAPLPADLKCNSVSQVIYYNWPQKRIVLPSHGMWKGERENEEVFQSQRAIFVPPYTTGLGLCKIQYVREGS